MMKEVTTFGRILVITHLCLVFTIVTWKMLSPWVLQAAEIQGTRTLLETTLKSQHFQTLSLEEQDFLMSIRDKCEHPPSHSLKESIKEIADAFSSTASFLLVWLALSIVLCFLLLFRIEGAALATIILPLLAVSLLLAEPQHNERKNFLFPTEEELVTGYLKENKANSLKEQREQLIRGWKLYLVKIWAEEPPANDPTAFAEQVELGAFHFRLAQIHQTKGGVDSMLASLIPSSILIRLFVIWNGLFWVYWTFNRSAPSLPGTAFP